MNPINHSQFLIHVIFSTKQQQPLITEEIEPLLYDRISKILFDDCYSPALKIGGTADHIHILYAQSRTWSVDDIINHVRKLSAEFARKFVKDFDWQESYAAFTISRSEDEFEKKYIADQKEFHQKILFKDEFRQILDKLELEYDENEMWGWRSEFKLDL